MGRKRTNLSRIFFTYNDIDKKSICNICQTPIGGDHAANLGRHLKRHHDIEFENVQALQAKKTKWGLSNTLSPNTSSLENHDEEILELDKFIKTEFIKTELLKVKLNKENIINACIELVTVNGCPFEMLDYSGFRKILNPICSALGKNFSINSEIIQLCIPETALRISLQIAKIMEKKMISLKIDIASRLNRTILGIHAQLITDGKINLFTLGMTELNNNHTEIYIKNMLEKVLQKYRIDFHQIYSVTTNNGANMISFANLLEDGMDDENSVVNETRNNAENSLFFTEEESFAFNNLIGTRCAAHTLQLAIKDFFKNSDLNELIFEARELVKKLQDPSFTQKFRELKIRKPVLNYSNKWNSIYNMLQSLLECKTFISSLAENNLHYYFPEKKWLKLKLVIDTLQPLTEATLKLQSEQLSLSDFYCIWIQCKIKLGNLKNFFSNILYKEICKKETSLLENDSLLGALYLDPRFQIVLTAVQKTQAIKHLKSVWNKIQFLESSLLDETASFSDSSSEQPNELEDFLKAKELAMVSRTFHTSSNVDIELQLHSFNHIQRIDSKKPILEFWEENKNIYPYLYKIAMVVLGAPATQVSVERAFSGLKFILQNRSHLNKNILEDIFIIRSNSTLL